MQRPWLTVRYIGGPTALLDLNGARFLTDPTFDPAGTEYPTKVYTLRKTIGPAISPQQIGSLDAILLSHDHHSDNLDHLGRASLGHASTVVTTTAGAGRLGGAVFGLAPWQTTELATPRGAIIQVTGTPARHGPAGGDRGPVTGFVIRLQSDPDQCVYVSGDTVWFEGIEEIAKRFPVRVALLFMGAARVREVGPDHLTFTASEGIRAARAFDGATIIPVHFEGWTHFSETREDIEAAFNQAQLQERLRLLTAGEAAEFIDEVGSAKH